MKNIVIKNHEDRIKKLEELVSRLSADLMAYKTRESQKQSGPAISTRDTTGERIGTNKT